MPTYEVTPLIRISVVLSYIALVVLEEPEFSFNIGELATDELGINNTEEEYNFYLTWSDERPQPTWQNILDNYVAAWNWGYLETGIKVIERQNYHRSLLTTILENGDAIADVSATLPAPLNNNLGLLSILNVHTEINADRTAINQLRTALEEAQSTLNTLLAERRVQGIQDA